MRGVVSTSIDPTRLAEEVEACLNGGLDAGRTFLAFLSQQPNRSAQVQEMARTLVMQGRAQEATRVYQAVVWALEGRPDAEFALAVTRLLAQAPQDANPSAKARAEIEIDLARGDVGRAARRAERLHRHLPDDHYVTAASKGTVPCQ